MKTFPLGKTVLTRGAHERLTSGEIDSALRRHVKGDWGELCAEDARMNDEAVEAGERLLSSYYTPSGVRFWIITEADRSVTTVLLPEEY